MGGQQFLSEELLLDLRGLNRIHAFNSREGTIRVGAGIQWLDLIQGYLKLQSEWGIRQKQTGADNFTLGGSLSANVHGRGLQMPPFISDVLAFTLVNAEGELIRCSRTENAELFRLAAGGYGLFGVIVEVELQLCRRRYLRREVQRTTAQGLMKLLDAQLQAGAVYGDFQFRIDETDPAFLQEGICSCYLRSDEPPDAAPVAKELNEEEWMQLLWLAHTDRAEAFRRYSDYYLSTSGQHYWSDTHQLSPYLPDYAKRIREISDNSRAASSLMITELYVPRNSLAEFLASAAELIREKGATVIYGTVRLIEQDSESFLAWAKESYACVIFNLLVEHTVEGGQRSADCFRGLIDLAAERGGSYYLTYHRYATAEQVRGCYPQMDEFLRLKRKYDPEERFQSDWYRQMVDSL